MKAATNKLLALSILLHLISCTSIKTFTAKYSPFTTRKEVVLKGEEVKEGEGTSDKRQGNTVDSSLLTVNRQQSTVNLQPTTQNPKPKTDTTVNIQPTTYILQLPTIPREFRAAWIATVANINWPSKPGLSTAEQKEKEAAFAAQRKATLAKLAALGLELEDLTALGL